MMFAAVIGLAFLGVMLARFFAGLQKTSFEKMAQTEIKSRWPAVNDLIASRMPLIEQLFRHGHSFFSLTHEPLESINAIAHAISKSGAVLTSTRHGLQTKLWISCHKRRVCYGQDVLPTHNTIFLSRSSLC